LVVGAAGMLGRKLVARLAADGLLGGRAIDAVVAADVAASEPADVSEPGVAERLVAERPDVIFHLAAVVSGEAEADFDKGYRVNLDGMRLLLEAIRAREGYAPRLVFASSIAVFGAPFPEPIGDDFASAPLT